MKKIFSKDVLKLDPEKEVQKISNRMREIMAKDLKRRGAVLGLSGGIDSSVTAALCVRAFGPTRVVGILMPERHSADESLRLGHVVADHLGIEAIEEDITQILEALGFYERYDSAVQMVIPEYGTGWKSKIVTSSVFEKKGFTVFSIVAQTPDGRTVKERLPLKPYLEIVAATNFKQRTRKLLEYHHADRLNYAVIGTPNRLEYDQGFFVKTGDGAADIKAIAHLYKSQVYQLAEYLEVPEEIRTRPPTTDTYSLSQSQDEFYFSLPFNHMDLCLYGKNNGVSAEVVAAEIGLKSDQVQSVYDDIDTKRSTTRYLHLSPLLLDEVPEISTRANR
jgi:NAD+ synthase